MTLPIQVDPADSDCTFLAQTVKYGKLFGNLGEGEWPLSVFLIIKRSGPLGALFPEEEREHSTLCSMANQSAGRSAVSIAE